MKKFFVITALICSFAAGTVSAEGFPLARYGLGFSNTTIELSKTKLALSGVGLSGSSFWGDEFGFLTSYGIYFPSSGTTNGSALSLDSYDLKLDISFLLGPGYKFRFGENFGAIVGAGFHMGETLLNSSSLSVSSFGVLALGVGFEAGVQYYFTESFGLNASLNAAYDFNAPIEAVTGETYKSSTSVIPSVGIAFKL